MDEPKENNPFDAETWAMLPSFFDELPNPVTIHCWGDPNAGEGEREAKILLDALSEKFEGIDRAYFPRRINYPYYPVIGVFGRAGDVAVDYGVRIIGLPKGVQMTSLISAIQAVSFRGVTIEAKSRIRLGSLEQDIRLELLTSQEDESGTMMAKTIFGLAVASPRIRSFLIMADTFPEASQRYSAAYLPHLVINGRVHVDRYVEEEEMLRNISLALK